MPKRNQSQNNKARAKSGVQVSGERIPKEKRQGATALEPERGRGGGGADKDSSGNNERRPRQKDQPRMDKRLRNVSGRKDHPTNGTSGSGRVPEQGGHSGDTNGTSGTSEAGRDTGVRELNDRHKRQSAIYNPSDHAERTVTIVGLGNIGSHATLALARMGIQNIELYDFDTVENHNLASQSYAVQDIGTTKVKAITRQIEELAPNCNIEGYTIDFKGTETVKDIVVIAVDSMQARYDIAEQLQKKDVFVIDGRLGGGQIEVHAQPAKEWKNTLVREADSDPCGARYISYTSYIIAGIIANTVKRHIMAERDISRLLMHTMTYDHIIERYE